ncbi:MAG: peptidylprolyl isomerase, partial [Candidatus Omnitrophica bacterium]|nr:peptidylprolyl isomerase [Candidatus Omnitrophota bacterium]
MLKILRGKKVYKKILIPLASIIVLAFVFWGSSSLMRDRSRDRTDGPVGTLFGRKVGREQFDQALEAVKNLAIIRFGDNFSEVADYLNLEVQAWERIALLHEARTRKIKASDREVVESIQKYAFFHNDEGAFDQKRYYEILQYYFQTQPRVFEEQMRQNLIIAKLYEQVAGAVSLTDEEVREEYERRNEEISISYLAAFPSDLTEGITPSETQIGEYYERNSVSFKEPLAFRVAYVSAPEEKTIQEMQERAQRNKDFAAAAGELNLEVTETDFFAETDPIPGLGWEPRLNKILSVLEEGELAPPFSTEENVYYLLKLTRRRTPSIPELKEIKDKVAEAFIQAESVKLARQKIEAAHDALTRQLTENPGNLNLAHSAKQFGLKSDSTGLFKYRSYIEGLGASDAFWLAARRLKKDDISDIINSPSGFFIITPKEKVPVDEEAFEEEKEDFREKV